MTWNAARRTAVLVVGAWRAPCRVGRRSESGWPADKYEDGNGGASRPSKTDSQWRQLRRRLRAMHKKPDKKPVARDEPATMYALRTMLCAQEAHAEDVEQMELAEDVRFERALKEELLMEMQHETAHYSMEKGKLEAELV